MTHMHNGYILKTIQLRSIAWLQEKKNILHMILYYIQDSDLHRK